MSNMVIQVTATWEFPPVGPGTSPSDVILIYGSPLWTVTIRALETSSGVLLPTAYTETLRPGDAASTADQMVLSLPDPSHIQFYPVMGDPPPASSISSSPTNASLNPSSVVTAPSRDPSETGTSSQTVTSSQPTDSSTLTPSKNDSGLGAGAGAGIGIGALIFLIILGAGAFRLWRRHKRAKPAIPEGPNAYSDKEVQQGGIGLHQHWINGLNEVHGNSAVGAEMEDPHALSVARAREERSELKA